MNEELFKHLLNLKRSLVCKAVNRLPESIQKPVKDFETQMMRVFYDISKEYFEKAPISENTKQAGGVKVIDVE